MGNERIVFVKLRSYDSLEIALLYKTLLESADINVRLRHGIIAQVIPCHGGPIRIDLLVPEEEKSKAEELLAASFDPTEMEAEEAEYQETKA